MNNKNVFLEEEIPYKKLEKIGIDRKSILQMPKELIEPLLGGRQTPLIQAAFKTTEGKIMQIPLKLQLVRDKEGNASIMVFPARKEVNNDIKLSPYELERLQKGEILKKEVNNDGTRRVKFIQLDRETNNLLLRNISSVRLQDKLKDIEKIKDIELGAQQKQAIVEGKAVELNVGNQKVTVGVDLKEPQGFKIVKGDMREWEIQQMIRYDLEHEGFMGYVKTDQNRWEYQQVVDKLQHKGETNFSQKQENKQSSGIKM